MVERHRSRVPPWRLGAGLQHGPGDLSHQASLDLALAELRGEDVHSSATPSSSRILSMAPSSLALNAAGEMPRMRPARLAL